MSYSLCYDTFNITYMQKMLCRIRETKYGRLQCNSEEDVSLKNYISKKIKHNVVTFLTYILKP